MCALYATTRTALGALGKPISSFRTGRAVKKTEKKSQKKCLRGSSTSFSRGAAPPP
jgi:hypothetical protein